MSGHSGGRRTSTRPKISVRVEERAWKSAGPALVTDLKRAARQALSCANASSSAGLTILLTDDGHLQSLNKQHRAKDRPTNVLSFTSSTPGYLGDIAIAHGVTALEAEEAGKGFAHHAIHLAVHGTLHLLGYDHVNSKDAEEMEALETDILARMGIPDPYGQNAA